MKTPKLAILAIIAICLICLQLKGRLEADKNAGVTPVGIIFSHSLHIEDVGLECSKCHNKALSSMDGLERLLPEMYLCGECHNIEDETGCNMCHIDPYNVVKSPAAGINYKAFSHKVHLEKQVCRDCHPVESGVSQTGRSYPDMKGCVDCHQVKHYELSCQACHIKFIPPKPSSHQFDWAKLHGEQAEQEMDDCAMCHKSRAKDDCAKCHQGAMFGSPHPQKFNHSQAYLRAGGFADCQTCHEPESFCVACHTQKMVMPASHSRPGWAVRTGGTHIHQAEIDFDYCIICHSVPVKKSSCNSPVCHH